MAAYDKTVGELREMFFGMLLDDETKQLLQGEFLVLDEAICWVAFDQYRMPAVGPRAAYEFLLLDDYSQWQEEMANRDEQLFEHAREQVFNAAENGHILLFGKMSDTEFVEFEPPIGRVRGSDLMYARVTPEQLKTGGWSESAQSYRIGEVTFDGLFLRMADLHKVFGPLKKSLPSDGLPPREKPNNQQPSADETTIGRPRGRRPKYDWEMIIAGVAHSIGKLDKLPDNQAALEVLIAEYCLETIGEEPSVSRIRAKASPMFQLLRQKSL